MKRLRIGGPLVMTRRTCIQIAVIAGLLAAACNGARDTELDDQGVTHLEQPTEPGDPGSTGGDGEEPVAPEEDPGSAGGSSSGSTSSSSGSTGTKGCQFKDNVDHDGDGLSFVDGDCNDCDANMRPGNLDEPGNGKDEDCSGKADDDGA